VLESEKKKARGFTKGKRAKVQHHLLKGPEGGIGLEGALSETRLEISQRGGEKGWSKELSLPQEGEVACRGEERTGGSGASQGNWEPW